MKPIYCITFQVENDEASEEGSTTHTRERRDSSKENEDLTNIEHCTRTNSNRNKKPGEEEESENERAHVCEKYAFMTDNLESLVSRVDHGPSAMAERYVHIYH
jgi:hypothetical protein